MPTQVEIQQEITDRILEGSEKRCCAVAKAVASGPELRRTCQFRFTPTVFWDQSDPARPRGDEPGVRFAVVGHLSTMGRNRCPGQKRPADLQPGQWGTRIVLWKQIERNKQTADGTEETERFPMLRYFTVFNLDQVEGSAVDHLRASAAATSDSPLGVDYEPAQRAIDATGAEIRYGGNRAYYVRPIGEFPNHTGGDFICLPDRGQFVSPHDLYAVTFHELCHWTQPRRGWTGSYPMGELIAEIGACFLCARSASRTPAT